MYHLNAEFEDEKFYFGGVFTIEDFLSNDDINILKKYYKKTSSFSVKGETEKDSDHLSSPSFIVYDEEKPKDNPYRNSRIIWINRLEEKGIRDLYKKITSKVIETNTKYFKFKLTDIEPLQYTIYEKGEYYKKHTDVGTLLSAGGLQRKLSFSIQLSDETEYEGGELCLYNCEIPTIASKKRGSLSFFDSISLHEVTPVIEGKREALVGWVWGPRFV